MIDFKAAKAKVQTDISPVKKPGSTCRKITLPDHDWSGVSHNSITPMTHLFMETELNLESNSEEEEKWYRSNSIKCFLFRTTNYSEGFQ